MTYLWVALGSALGGVARFGCTSLTVRWLGGTFPWGTLLVNIAGSLAIGFLATLATADGRGLLSPDARAFLIVGICGGFTTFSAFSFETLMLARAGQWAAAVTYVLASVLVCLLAVWLGYAVATALSR